VRKHSFFKTHSQKPQEALNPLVTEERYWPLLYMPLYTFLHSLLNVLVQTANKMGSWGGDFLKPLKYIKVNFMRIFTYFLYFERKMKILSYFPHFGRTKLNRLMQSPCYLWIPLTNIWIPEHISMKLGMYIMAPEAIHPSNHSVCVWTWIPPFTARQMFRKHVPTATNTQNNRKFVGHMCCRSASIFFLLLLLSNNSVKVFPWQQWIVVIGSPCPTKRKHAISSYQKLLFCNNCNKNKFKGHIFVTIRLKKLDSRDEVEQNMEYEGWNKKCIQLSGLEIGHSIAQVVSRWLSTVATQVWVYVRSCGICGG
jgi:hypothetical protein